MTAHHKLTWTNEPSTVGGGSKLEAGSEFFSGETSNRRSCCLVVSLSVSCLLLLVTCLTLTVLLDSSRWDGSPRWRKLVLDYQNISEDIFSLTEENMELKRNSEHVTRRCHLLDELRTQLNETSAELEMIRLVFSSETNLLMERILNQTFASVQVSEERELLVQKMLTQQQEIRNKSLEIEMLTRTNDQLQEEKRNHLEERETLRDEMMSRNQEVQEMNERLQREIQKSQESLRNLSMTFRKEQDRNHNLSLLLANAADNEKSLMKDHQKVLEELQSSKEAFHTLDLYCPVTDRRTNERVCRRCEDGWRLFQNRCYYFSTRKLPWNPSRYWCQSQEGDLLTVNSQQEQMFIFNTSQALEPESRVWIGLTDQEVEGDWRWVDGSSPTSDLKFWLSRPGMAPEPDDWKQDDPLGEDCGHIDTIEKITQSWMDASCKTEYRWICKKNV